MNASAPTSEPELQETSTLENGKEMADQDSVGIVEAPALEGCLQGGEDGEKGEIKDADPLLVKRPEESTEDAENAKEKEDGPLLADETKLKEVMFFTSASEVEDEANPREKAFSEDIYSLIYTAKVRGLAFGFAIAIFIMQITILLLIFVDLVDLSNDPPVTPNGEKNRMKIPAGKANYVSVAQFFGVALTINFMAHGGDLLKGLTTLIRGYNPEITQRVEGANKFKWLLSGTLQAFAGFMMTMDLFILMMQSTNVIGMCLNFAALYFVQDIDDCAFAIASIGLIGRRVQEECLRVGDIMIPAYVRKANLWLRRAFMTCVWIGFYAFYFRVTFKQTNGDYRCTALFIQFGDAFFPEMPYYGGRYNVKYGKGKLPIQFHDRSIFWDETETIRVRYSKHDKAWVIERNYGKTSSDSDNQGYMFKSSETSTFDVVDVAGLTWYANTPGGDVPVDWMYMSCDNCNPDQCLGGCENDRCVCEVDKVGHYCEADFPSCTFLGLDLRTSAAVKNIPGGYFFYMYEFEDFVKYSMDRLKFRFSFYDRSIYIPYSFGVDMTHETVVHWIAFTGRRWIIFGAELSKVSEINATAFRNFLRITQLSNATERKNGLRDLAANSGYVPVFFSSPVDVGTPNFGYDPTSVTWVFPKTIEHNGLGPDSVFRVGPNDDDPIPAQFLCSDCEQSQNCGNGGKCNEDWGYCMCEPFYSGYQCEYSHTCDEMGCFNGGVCNPFTGACEHCIPQSSGTLCQYPLSPHLQKNKYFCNITNGLLGPCQNDQSCNGIEQKCECEEPFYGEFCEFSTRANCSELGPIWGPKIRPVVEHCQNGGYCDWHLDYPICRCRDPFVGDFCEVDPEGNSTETLTR